jgi:hypothetical protein
MPLKRAANQVRAMFAKPEILCGKLTVGATGAVSAFYGYGIESCTRDSAGVYSLVLEAPYAAIVGASVMQIGTKQDLTFQITAEDVGNATKASRKITVTCKTANTATDPTSGTKLAFMFMFANSSKLGFGPDRA